MKIVYYSTAYYATHGGRHHARAFVSNAARHGVVTWVKVFPEEQGVQQSVSGGGWKGAVKKVLTSSRLFLPLRLRRRNKLYLRELFTFIERHRPDAIVMRLDSNYKQIRALKTRYPDLVVATEVNASPFDESYARILPRSYFQRQERRYLAGADRNFFVSATLRRSIMQDRLNEIRDRVNQNGVDLAVFKPQQDKAAAKRLIGVPENDLVIGYLGSLAANKRVDWLLEAFRQVQLREPRAHLLVVGDGEAAGELRQLATRLLPAGSFTFTGRQPHDKVPDYLAAFDIAVHHHALAYMSPLKVFEYLAAGLPVIAPGTPAVREVFQDRVHVLLTPPGGDTLADDLTTLIGDAALRRQLAQEGYRLVSQRYTWQANAAVVVEGIQSVTN